MGDRLVIERPDGEVIEVRGYRASAPHADVQRYGGGRVSAAKLPPRVDLRPHMTKIENQGGLSSCVANAVAGAYEYLVKRHLEEDYDVSRLFIYYNARQLHGAQNRDDGTGIDMAVASLARFGACSEEVWPYREAKVNAEPDEEAYEEAANFPVEDIYKLPVDLNVWKQCLAEGYPIIFGLLLFGSFDKHRRPGMIPTPGDNEVSRAEHSAHAMLCVGYSDPDQVFIVRNSWGTKWGDQGYCYIPYRYMMDGRFNFGDCWFIRQLEALELDEETWGEDEELLEDLPGMLAGMDEEAYEALLDDLGDVSLEHRLALLFIFVAAGDGDLSEDELDAIAEHLQEVFEAIGSEFDPTRVMQKVLKKMDRSHKKSVKLLEETVEIFGNHFTREALASIINGLEAVSSVDGLDDGEADFINTLVDAWQIDDDEAWEYDEEEGDEEDEEDWDEEEDDDEW